MSHPTRYTLLVRKQIEVNTDSQRRCYYGAHAKSEMVWTEWGEVCNPATLEEGNHTVDCFQKINPTRQYKLTPPDAKALA